MTTSTKIIFLYYHASCDTKLFSRITIHEIEAVAYAYNERTERHSKSG